MNIEKNKLNWIYKKLFTIRFFEERIKKIAKKNQSLDIYILVLVQKLFVLA